MGYTEQLIGNAIFETETNLTATDLTFQSFWSAAGGSFPTPVAHGDYYGISVGGNLPPNVGVVVPGDFIFYSSTKGWSKGAVVKIGVSQINGKTGYVTLNTDDLTDIGYAHKFITQAEKDKLSAIEVGAQVNDTALQIKTKYESNADTNAFTDANLTKLNGIEALADVNVIETVKLNGVALPVNSKEVNIVIGAVFNIKGSVPTYSALPSSGQVNGDTYQVIDTGLSYYWLDTDWESMGGTIDLSSYYTKTETYSKSEVDTALANKVDKAVGKQLSTEDYTSTEKTKLAGIEDGAQVNDYKLKVSNTDVLQGSLSDKLVAGTNVTLTVLNPGANEQIQITSTGSGGGGDVASVNGVLPVLGNVTITKTDIGLGNVTNVAQLPYTALDTDNTLAANSDVRVSSQKAIKSYIEGLSAINSNGVFSLPTITDNGDGTVTLGTDGIINFYKDVDGKTAIVKLAVTNGATLTLADQAQNFVYCDYNAGTPTYNTSTNQGIFYADTRLTPVIRITREGTILWLNDYGDYANAQSGKILLKDTIENGFRRNTGLDLTTSSTRQINISAGTVWFGTNALSLPASISGDVGTKFYEYYKVSNVWTKSTNLTEFDSTYYSNGVDKLTLVANQWVCKYIFKNTDSKNEMYYVSGNAYNTRAEAFAEVVPSLPTTLLGHAVFVGKIIIQKSQALGVAYGRNYTGYITNGSVTSHNDFANIQGVGSGITAGHISDVAQTIYGDKTFAGTTTSNDINLTALTGANIITDTSVKTTLQNVDNIYTVTKQSTGFTNNDTINISYDSTARTITLTGTFEAYFRGKKVAVLTNGWVSSSHATGLAKYYLYYDGSAFVWATTAPTDDALRIADVYYNTVEKFAVRRTFGFMQPETRKDLHKNIGSYVASGGTLSGYTVSSNVDTNRRPSIALTEIVDEDLTTLSPAHTSQLYTKMYLTASGTSNFTLETAEIVPLNGNQPYYNQLVTGTWQQTLLPADNYMSVWLVALPVTSDTNSQKYRYVWVQGQSISAGLSTIQGKTPADVNLGTLPSMTSEYIFLAKVIIQYVSGNWIIVQADLLRGNRFSQTMIYGSSTGDGSVSVDSSISGTGTVESPLSITSTTVAFTNKTIDGGTF